MRERKQTWQQWARAVERDPHTPSRIRKGSLAPLTGTDHRVLDAFVACLELYSYDRDADVLLAASVLLSRMQTSTRWVAKELIAFVLDWPDRERLWPLIDNELAQRSGA